MVSGPFSSEPVAYATPVGAEAVGRLIEWASGQGVPIIPRGAGTGMPGGNLGPHVIADIGPGLTEIELVDGTAGRLRVGAGVTGLDADRFARSHGRFLPFLPSSRRWCRVGGMVGTNAAGARTFGYGSIRDWVVGVEGYFADGSPFVVRRGEEPPPRLAGTLEALAVLPRSTDGSLVGWPRVRKNSSGYALDRALATPGEEAGHRAAVGPGGAIDLLVGSEGTLGIVTHVELATAPVPESVGLALVPLASPGALTDLSAAARDLGAVACEFLGHRLLEMMRFGMKGSVGMPSPGTVPYAVAILEMEGAPGSLDGPLTDFARAFAAPGTDFVVTDDPTRMEAVWSLRHEASPVIAREADRGRISTQFIEDSVVPPERLGDYLAGLDEILEPAGVTAVVFGHAGDANVHANPLLDVTRSSWLPTARGVMRDVVSLVASLGGTLTGEHGDGRIRAPFLTSIWPEHLTDAFRLVKARLDPMGTLNPGVVVPTDGQDPFQDFRPRPRSYPVVET